MHYFLVETNCAINSNHVFLFSFFFVILVDPTIVSPIHNSKKPRELLWFDRTEIEKKTNTQDKSPLLLIDTKTKQEQNDNQVTRIPVKPGMDTVGEFKVTPSTHFGYGLTWFGLSGAGIIMTRKLITRGRG
jgi:cytochrome oxidase assembly protein ShyY1